MERRASRLVEGSESGRVSDADGTAGEARAGVAGLLRVGVVAATEVVDTGVKNDATADDRTRTAQAQLAVGDVKDDSAVLVGNDVAQVSGVADLVLGSAVGLVERVVVAAGGEAALARDVTKLVNVETVGR